MTLSLQQRATIILTKLHTLYPTIKPALNASNPLEFLFAVMLSAQCTDAMVNRVTAELFKKYPSIEDYLSVDLETFEQDIKSIGLYKSKAKNILATVKIIHEQHHDKVPDTMEELIVLPGVGRKTANVVLGCIYNKPVGIAVDTHVKRLSQLYGLTTQTNPEKIEQELMKLLPQQEWTDFTLRMIEYGREYCPARSHKHEQCPLFLALQESK